MVRLQTEAGDLWPALLAQGRADLLGYAPERVDRALANLDVLAARAARIAQSATLATGQPAGRLRATGALWPPARPLAARGQDRAG